MDKSVCFSVLAFKSQYQRFAKSLAADLARFAPGVFLVVGTENPKAFSECSNVIAFKLKKTGILHCYNDKRFVIKKALQQFRTVIQIDADTKITASLPQNIDQSPGIAGSYLANMVEHSQRYNPRRLCHLNKLASKLGQEPNDITFVGEALFAITAEGAQAKEFIRQWDLMARYLEIKGLHSGEGNIIGLAAAKAGLEITAPAWVADIKTASEHLDASRGRQPIDINQLKNFSQSKFVRSLNYHYRLNRTKFFALRDFDFYYR